jgi:regulator of sigma E protease
MTILLHIIAFLVAVFILVLAHEFGHFLVAIKAGIKVERFSIGFGKPMSK